MTTRLPLVYHDCYSFPFPDNHRFPMAKFRLLHDLLRAEGLLGDDNLHRPDACPGEVLALTHCPDYLQRFVTGTLTFQEGRRLGLPWSPALVTRTLHEVGGTLLTARLALRHGLACHLAGGTHHAHRDAGSGFCALNDLAVTARALLASGEARRILIVDCDVHQGDGTARLLAGNPGVFTLSLHCEKNFPARKAVSSRDVGLPNGLDDDGYLAVLAVELDEALKRFHPELVLLDAGVDVHADDGLGYLMLSDAGLAARDHLVLSRCLQDGIPVAGVLGGGYDRDPAKVAHRHAFLHRAASALWPRYGRP
ncbi:histone deacetylase family protein [Perlucidibaca piscinae]|uniref:histone deacetylase family protein n=1 Tax=Perlucidibaca piscinae TaxID=392589 RepID=UPI0003B46BB1|nr:histone deacetylase [Perlucidibaca piscinae]